jgi:hypothetical protein
MNCKLQQGAAIVCNKARVVIRDTIFEGNYGDFLQEVGSLHIYSSILRGNTFRVAIHFQTDTRTDEHPYSMVFIQDSTFESNALKSIFVWGAPCLLVIHSSVFSFNKVRCYMRRSELFRALCI